MLSRPLCFPKTKGSSSRPTELASMSWYDWLIVHDRFGMDTRFMGNGQFTCDGLDADKGRLEASAT
jgi:hypothetical protein